MLPIEPLTSSSPPTLLESARALFLAYGVFLRSSGGHERFNYVRLEEEARDLPAAYEDNHGELLVAVSEGSAVGCIAYRAHLAGPGESSCEIKRLFVRPDYRARGIGRSLVLTALERARIHGYRFAYLDTDPETMAAAHHTYLELGFVEYDKRSSCDGCLCFLRKPLV